MIASPSRMVMTVAILLAAIPAGAAVCDGVSVFPNTSLESVTVTTGLTGRPLFVTSPPGDVNRLFIVEQSGFIRIHKRGDPAGTTTLFLDISAKVQASAFLNEMGLLGLAFDPDYATNGRFYVNYTEGATFGPYASVVARYNVSAGNPDLADPTSEVRLLRFAQPQSNHNGGWMTFGPDGFFYIATGDGGGSGDQHGTCGNGQIRTTLLGKLLRIDVRGLDPAGTAPECSGLTTPPYTIPSGNLYRGASADCGEIWSYGLRNPWRPSFDGLTGALYVADVGQNCWEEINYVASPGNGGQNYGWRQMEGMHCFDTNNQSNCDPIGAICAGSPACNDPSLIDPVLEYSHSVAPSGCSVTGGYAYRGCRMSALQGTYFYGDYCSGWVKSFVISGGVPTSPADWTAQLDPGGGLVNNLTSFGEDAQREMYLIARSGSVRRMVPPFTAIAVSAPSAGPFRVDRGAPWTWEDLRLTHDRPVTAYRIYRGTPNGLFNCIHKATAASWTGDPVDPAAGQLFAYVVTAIEGTRETATEHAGTFDPSGCP